MWYKKSGPSGDVVLSSRIRFARNIKGIPFSKGSSEEQQKKIVEICKDAVLGGDELSKKLRFIDLSVMHDYEKQALSECHLISPEMIDNKVRRGLVLSDDQKISIMINEEDHLRIQCMAEGFNLRECFSLANKVDNLIESKIDYAFDEKFGYLTCCPTNLGTGMRASVMVHLPALVMTKRIESVFRSLGKLGMTVRGIYGEGSEAQGNIFQISNQVTLGVSEEETIQKLNQIVIEVVEKEREIRKTIYKNEKYRFEDRIMRAYGVLTNAVLLTSGEAMSLISDVRLGINMGIVKNLSIEELNDIMYSILPANIIKAYNLMDSVERNIKRPEIIREKIKGKVN